MAKMERLLALANRLSEEKTQQLLGGSPMSALSSLVASSTNESNGNGRAGSDLSASDYHTGSNSDHEGHTDDNDDDGYSSCEGVSRSEAVRDSKKIRGSEKMEDSSTENHPREEGLDGADSKHKNDEAAKQIQRCKFPIWSKGGGQERKRRRIDDIGLLLLANQGKNNQRPEKRAQSPKNDSPMNLKKTSSPTGTTPTPLAKATSIFSNGSHSAQSILNSAITADFLAKTQQHLHAAQDLSGREALEKRLRLEEALLRKSLELGQTSMDANEALLEKLRTAKGGALGALNTLSFMNSLKSSSPSPGLSNFRSSPLGSRRFHEDSNSNTPSPPVTSISSASSLLGAAARNESLLAGKLGLNGGSKTGGGSEPLYLMDEDEDEGSGNGDDGSPGIFPSSRNQITDIPVYSGFGDFGKDSKQTSECTICRRVLAGGKGALEVHMRVHTGEKPFACRYCGSRFTQSASRNRHEKRKSCGTNLQYPGGF